MKTAVVLLMVMLLATACSRQAKSGKAGEPKKHEPEQKSVATEVIHGFTGKTAVDHGRRAQETIERVSAEKNASLNEIEM